MAVEWFLRRENSRWLGWKRITRKIHTSSMEDKMAAGALRALGIMVKRPF